MRDRMGIVGQSTSAQHAKSLLILIHSARFGWGNGDRVYPRISSIWGVTAQPAIWGRVKDVMDQAHSPRPPSRRAKTGQPERGWLIACSRSPGVTSKRKGLSPQDGRPQSLRLSFAAGSSVSQDVCGSLVEGSSKGSPGRVGVRALERLTSICAA